MARIELTARARAPRDVVWEVLTASDSWADWSADLTHSVRAADGQEHPDGVGAVRELWAAGLIPLREQVEVFDPAAGRYAYSLRPMPPVRAYRADVELDDDGGATTIRWAVEVTPVLPLPGAGTALSLVVRIVISRLLKALVAEAERRTTRVSAAA